MEWLHSPAFPITQPQAPTQTDQRGAQKRKKKSPRDILSVQRGGVWKSSESNNNELPVLFAVGIIPNAHGRGVALMDLTTHPSSPAPTAPTESHITTTVNCSFTSHALQTTTEKPKHAYISLAPPTIHNKKTLQFQAEQLHPHRATPVLAPPGEPKSCTLNMAGGKWPLWPFESRRQATQRNINISLGRWGRCQHGAFSGVGAIVA